MKKPVLILEHEITENLAYLGTWLSKHNIDYVVCNAEKDKEFPSSIEPYSALAVMGGARSVNDLLYTNRQAEILILQAMYNDIPVIGHCLGGQLMAKALGAKVIDSPMPEIGWQEIQYTDSPLTKEWFGDNPTQKVIHWHYESFEVPKGATLLASSDACPNQAFSIGKHLAMQFHIEIDDNKVMSWVRDDDDKWQLARNQYQTVHERFRILNESKKHLTSHQSTANIIYKNWLKTTDFAENLGI